MGKGKSNKRRKEEKARKARKAAKAAKPAEAKAAKGGGGKGGGRNRKPYVEIISAMKDGIWDRLPTPEECRKYAEMIPGEAAAGKPAFKMNGKAAMVRFLPEQVELVRWGGWVRDTGQRVILMLDGPLGCGKSETMDSFLDNMNPRGIKIIKLGPPVDDVEAGQWYFQRWMAQVPHAGLTQAFVNSWYRRSLVESVTGACTAEQKDAFFNQVNQIESMLVDDGVKIIKVYMDLTKEEQAQRQSDLAANSSQAWRIGASDVDHQANWDALQAAKEETFSKTSTAAAPWTVVKAGDWVQARIQVMRHVVNQFDYPDRSDVLAPAPDSNLVSQV